MGDRNKDGDGGKINDFKYKNADKKYTKKDLFIVMVYGGGGGSAGVCLIAPSIFRLQVFSLGVKNGVLRRLSRRFVRVFDSKTLAGDA
ncbi:MAG: hypothetical protein LBJ35_08165 [Spirochaetaceae bacterium]|nr:hypothetical protein [Spirochaetaceae bacterium]